MYEFLGGDVLLAEAARQGLWAILYVSLFVYTLKESKRREERLRNDYMELKEESRDRENKLTTFIVDITKQYERLATGVEKLSVDVDDIKDELKLRKEMRNRHNKGE